MLTVGLPVTSITEKQSIKTRQAWLLGVSFLLLAGCAGTQSDFQCNTSTSDSCITMEQANEKAKSHEENQSIKPDALSLPTLAEGNFRAQSAPAKNSSPSLPKSQWLTSPSYEKKPLTPATSTTRLTVASVKPNSVASSTPLRTVDQTARLWIAPYIDTQDVYHHAGWVEFVVTSSHWGTPRID